MKASVMRAAPMTLTLNVVSSCSLSEGTWEAIPALLMSTSNRPCSFSMCLAAAVMESEDVTSSWILDSWPLIPAALMAL